MDFYRLTVGEIDAVIYRAKADLSEVEMREIYGDDAGGSDFTGDRDYIEARIAARDYSEEKR